MEPDRENELVLSYAVPRPKTPTWVALGLGGMPWRWLAWAFFWLSVAATVAGIVLGLVLHPLCFSGALFLFSAAWYWAAIRWADRHGGWSQVKGKGSPL